MQTKIPPHLPPPVCDIGRHKKTQRIRMMLAIAALALLSGMSGAAITLGWIWPGWAEGDTWFASYGRSSVSRGLLEDRVRVEISDRVLSVYDELTNFSAGVNFLNKKNYLGDAFIISSDGWLAMYLPVFDGNFKNMTALGRDGRVYKAEGAIFDRNAGLLYLKVRRDNGQISDSGQFKVVTFEEKTRTGDELFVLQNGDWRQGWVESQVWSPFKSPHLDSAPARFFNLDGSFESGRLAINGQGRVVGLTKENSELLPSEYITRVLSMVLSRGVVEYPTLGVEGWFSEEQPVVVDKDKVNGFIVNRVAAASSLLRRGDVVLEIDGRVVSAENLWYNINGRDSVKLKIWRQGKEMELAAKVTRTK